MEMMQSTHFDKSVNHAGAAAFMLRGAAGVIATFFTFILTLAVAPVYGAESSLVIVTSYSEKLFTRTKAAFLEIHPEIDIKIILNKKTSAAISYVQNMTDPPPDLIWSSAPDAFEILKAGGYLEKYHPKAVSIPEEIRGYPIHDPDGYYTGFAISGYGLMWNTRYIDKYRLPPPENWADLTAPAYYRHIGMSAPSRSGTTHMAVESILQSKGWEAGWRTLMEIAGNLATITARSFGVPDGITNGRFGIGIVIDFFGLSSKAAGNPVDFTYPDGTALTPANIALVKGAQNPEAARRFIDFLVSSEGQRLLFEPQFQRLPVLPLIYKEAPKGYANPFLNEEIKTINFDSRISTERYYLVNALFDQLITYRHKAISKLWQRLHEADSKAAKTGNKKMLSLLKEARDIVTQVPVTDRMSKDPMFTSIFQHKRKGEPLPTRQAEIEKQWEDFSRINIKKAHELIIQAMALSK